MTIPVYVVDDEPMIRRLLKRSFEHERIPTFLFENGKQFLDAVDTLDPGIVLLDLRMPEMDGLGVLEALGSKTKVHLVLILSSHGDISTAVQAVHAGAIDFIEKPVSVRALIDRVNELGSIIESRRNKRVSIEAAQSRLDCLSERERQVGQELALGLSNKEIARKFDLSPRTVEAHRARIMHKLNVSSLAEIVRIFMSSE